MWWRSDTKLHHAEGIPSTAERTKYRDFYLKILYNTIRQEGKDGLGHWYTEGD